MRSAPACSSAPAADCTTPDPGLFLVYAFCGVFVFLILRALGELVLHRPSSGSFVSYAREFFGEKAAFVAGWMYFLNWAITAIVDSHRDRHLLPLLGAVRERPAVAHRPDRVGGRGGGQHDLGQRCSGSSSSGLRSSKSLR